MNHLQRKTVEQVNKQGMKCKGAATTERQIESIKRQWRQPRTRKRKKEKEAEEQHVKVMDKTTERN